MRCPRCGQEVAPGTAFCPYCQNPLMAPATPPPGPAAGYPQAGPPVGYPQPGYVQPQRTSSMATTSLIAGILSVTIRGLIAGIVAVITGFQARKEIAASGGTIGGEGQAKAGIIMGFISIGLSLIFGCIYLIIVLSGGLSSY